MQTNTSTLAVSCKVTQILILVKNNYTNTTQNYEISIECFLHSNSLSTGIDTYIIYYYHAIFFENAEQLENFTGFLKYGR